MNALSEDAQQAFVPMVLSGLLIYLCYTVGCRFGLELMFLCIIFAFIAFPSMIMAYVAKGNIIAAVNPFLFFRLIHRIGWPYLLMVFFLFLLLLAPNALVFAMGFLLPRQAVAFLYSFANSYYTLIFYHLMGYVLLQYHREIGYTINQEEFITPGKPPGGPDISDPASGILAKVEFLAKEGKYDEALDHIKRETQGKISDPSLSRQYVKLLTLKNDPELAGYLEHHIRLMIDKNDRQEACQAYLTGLSSKVPVSLSSPALIKLAGWFNESGAHRESVSVYSRVISNKSENGLVTMAYFRAACILYEKLNEKAKADHIFKLLKSKYPMDDIIPHVDHYLKKIEAAGVL